MTMETGFRYPYRMESEEKKVQRLTLKTINIRE